MTVSHQVENINKEIEIIKKNQIEIVEMQSTITKIKKFTGSFNSRFELAEERIKEFEDIEIKIIEYVKWGEKIKMIRPSEKYETPLNVSTYAQWREKGAKKLLEGVMAAKSPNLMKSINLYVQEE